MTDGAEIPADRPHPEDAVWTASNERPGRVGLPAYLAGTPLAVFAGFDLSSALLVVSQRPQSDRHPLMASLSSGLLLAALSALLAALAYAGRAQSVDITPDQALSWWPETTLNPAQFDLTRRLVWASQEVVNRAVGRALFWWVAGLWITAAGIAVGVLSYGTAAGHWIAAFVLPAGLVPVTRLFSRSQTLAGAASKRMNLISDRARDLIVRPVTPPSGASGCDSSQVI
jgi:hypothetical protein